MELESILLNEYGVTLDNADPITILWAAEACKYPASELRMANSYLARKGKPLAYAQYGDKSQSMIRYTFIPHDLRFVDGVPYAVYANEAEAVKASEQFSNWKRIVCFDGFYNALELTE